MGSERRSRSRKRHLSKRRHRYLSSGLSTDTSASPGSVKRYKRNKKSKHRKKTSYHKHSKKNKTSKSSSHKTKHSSTRKQTLTPPLINNIQESNVYTNNSRNRESSRIPESNSAEISQNNYDYSIPTQCANMHINVIPEFDPNDGSQNIEAWIHKVNECATIYSWNETQIRHYALTKLTGLAKRWYQGLPSLLYTWEQWTEKLKAAFPSTENYGELLQRMLQARCKIGQPLDVYYYEKMTLINRCEITGRKAVGCLVHGIDDKFIRMSANACRFEEPEQLFSYLKTLVSDGYSVQRRKLPLNKDDKGSYQSQSNLVSNYNEVVKPAIICFNCGEPGHIRTKCTQPMKRCNICRRVGHIAKDCKNNKSHDLINLSNNNNGPENVIQTTTLSSDKTTMSISANGSDCDKYFKNIKLEGFERQAFVDLGSNCSLLKESVAKEIYGAYHIDKELPNLRGFGNASVKPLGSIKGTLEVDTVNAEVELVVVSDQYMPCDIIIGQTFTELPNLVMYKTSKSLIFYEAPEISCSDIAIKIKIQSLQEFTIQPYTTSPVGVKTSNTFSGSLYVPISHCSFTGKNYMVLPGLYNFHKNEGYVMITNLNKDALVITKGQTLARGVGYEEIVEPYVGITDNTTLETHILSLQDIQVGTKLLNEDEIKFHQLLKNYRDCFALNLSELGKTSLTEMTIRLKDDIPVVYNPYRMSIKEKEQLSEIIGELLENGIIRESSSSYASPVILVNKKNGQKRLCIDYRALNRKTLKDKYPLPRIEDRLDSLGGNKFFTSLDLASGYYQVPVEEESKHLTAFITPDGLYEYNRMPFGLANAPSVFQRAINTMLKGAEQNLALAYMDDLLIPSKTIQEGLNKLEKVLQLLRKANLTLNPKKCVFFQTNIEYLGYEISENGIRPGNLKIEAVRTFPIPKNVHEVRQFMGLASYFRRFVQNFSAIARPLTKLTKKGEVWQFGPEQIKAFETLKEKLISRPILALYDPKANLEVHTDASKLGIGAILLQDGDRGLQPIAYYSRQTSPEEQKFHSYELETLAAITALNRFRVYLLGTSFKLVTDCNAIKSTMTKRDLIPRVARWWIAMQEFDFTIEYRAGVTMMHVDALSRNPVEGENPPSRDDDDQVFSIHWDINKIDVVDDGWRF